MRILFCGDPLNPRQPDEAYAEEVAAAERLGILWSPINFEPLVYEGDATQAVRRVPAEFELEQAMYRGWMLTLPQYAALYEALAAKQVQLINTPAQYEHCHYLPRWYARLEGETPRSVWTEADEDFSTSRLIELLRPFGSAPIIVKDWVKSRKHEWHEACFIPSASDTAAVERVAQNFLTRQGSDLNVGLVFREFATFEALTAHSRSGMPLTREYRLFFLDGEPLLASPYWDEGEYPVEELPVSHFLVIGAAD